MKNQAKGYNEEKENIKLPKINDKSYLQNRGAAILAAGNQRVKPNEIINVSRQQNALNHIYGGSPNIGAGAGYGKPPVHYNPKL